MFGRRAGAALRQGGGPRAGRASARRRAPARGPPEQAPALRPQRRATRDRHDLPRVRGVTHRGRRDAADALDGRGLRRDGRLGAAQDQHHDDDLLLPHPHRACPAGEGPRPADHRDLRGRDRVGPVHHRRRDTGRASDRGGVPRRARRDPDPRGRSRGGRPRSRVLRPGLARGRRLAGRPREDPRRQGHLHLPLVPTPGRLAAAAELVVAARGPDPHPRHRPPSAGARVPLQLLPRRG